MKGTIIDYKSLLYLLSQEEIIETTYENNRNVYDILLDFHPHNTFEWGLHNEKENKLLLFMEKNIETLEDEKLRIFLQNNLVETFLIVLLFGKEVNLNKKVKKWIMKIGYNDSDPNNICKFIIEFSKIYYENTISKESVRNIINNICKYIKENINCEKEDKGMLRLENKISEKMEKFGTLCLKKYWVHEDVYKRIFYFLSINVNSDGKDFINVIPDFILCKKKILAELEMLKAMPLKIDKSNYLISIKEWDIIVQSFPEIINKLPIYKRFVKEVFMGKYEKTSNEQFLSIYLCNYKEIWSLNGWSLHPRVVNNIIKFREENNLSSKEIQKIITERNY